MTVKKETDMVEYACYVHASDGGFAESRLLVKGGGK